MNIQTTRDIQYKGIFCLVHGPSGVGKTTLCLTLEKPFIIAAESGLLSLMGYDIHYAEPQTTQEINQAVDYAINSIQQGTYNALCLDSITKVSNIMVADAFKKNKDGRVAWSEYNRELTLFLDKLKFSGVNVYVTAHQARVEDSDSTQKYTGSVEGRQMVQYLPHPFDLVMALKIRMEAQKQPDGTSISIPIRYLQTSHDNMYCAKNRGGLLAHLEQPNLGYIFNKVLTGGSIHG